MSKQFQNDFISDVITVLVCIRISAVTVNKLSDCCISWLRPATAKFLMPGVALVPLIGR